MDDQLVSQAARGLVAAVSSAQRQGQLESRLPAGSNPAGEAPTVREAAAGAAYDLAWVPHTIAGGAVDSGPVSRDEDLLGGEPSAALSRLADEALAAVAAAPDPDQPVHLSYGDFPAREYLEHISTYYGLLALDIDRVTGDEPEPTLVDGLLRLLEPQAEMWRSIGVFGAQVEVPEDASPLARLRGLTGRQP
ncbi:MAG: hypothetical protein ACTHMZ_08415 [Actinomycetes bacterium]